MAVGSTHDDFHLNIDRQRGNPGQVAVDVSGVKIARIQIHPKPGAVDITRQCEQAVGRTGGPTVVFKGQKNAMLAGIFTAFLQPGNDPLVGFLRS